MIKFNWAIVFTATGYPSDIFDLGNQIKVPNLPALVHQFLLELSHPEASESSDHMDALLADREASGRFQIKDLAVFHSASATFSSRPCDVTGQSGFQRELIRANPCYRGHKRYDCVLVEQNPRVPGLQGMFVAQVKLFFSFKYEGKEHPCALLRWFRITDDGLDRQANMWVVEPEKISESPDSVLEDRMAVIHIDCIFRAAHLIPVYGKDPVPNTPVLHFSNVVGMYAGYYVNKYADHHMHETLDETWQEEEEEAEA